MKIGNRRARFLNYHLPGIYMVTLGKEDGCPDFSHIVAKNSPGSQTPDVRCRYHNVGFAIYHVLRDFSKITPKIVILQYVIMPDHVHLLLQIREETARALGEYISVFKRSVFKEALEKGYLPVGSVRVFRSGFNDQFLRSDRNLQTLYDYIRNNPYRLWVRREHPERFRRISGKLLDGIDCNLYGNAHLLANPFLYPVVIHRKDSESELERKKELWRYALANGGVLVGAFISKSEHKIFNGAASYGGRIILISNKTFAEREKPSGKLFELCEAGQLLIISPKMEIPVSEKGISRQECLFMNSFAESLAKGRR